MVRSDETGPALVSPHDIDAERAALGGAIVDNETFAALAAQVEAADFFRAAHKKIFAAMTRLHEAGAPIDPISLKVELGRVGELDDVGGVQYLSDLVNGVPRSANVAYYGRLVREAATTRFLVKKLPSRKSTRDRRDDRSTETALHGAVAVGCPRLRFFAYWANDARRGHPEGGTPVTFTLPFSGDADDAAAWIDSWLKASATPAEVSRG